LIELTQIDLPGVLRVTWYLNKLQQFTAQACAGGVVIIVEVVSLSFVLIHVYLEDE
jgi:hypothetical protein